MIFAMLLVAGCASQEATPAKSAGAIALEEKIAELNTCNEKITAMQKEVATLKSETAVFKEFRSTFREIKLGNKNTAPIISDLNKLNVSLSLSICQLYFNKYRTAYCAPLTLDSNFLNSPAESYGKITNNVDCISKVAVAREYLSKTQAACESYVIKGDAWCTAYFDPNVDVKEKNNYWTRASETYDNYSITVDSYSDAVNEEILSCFKN